MHMIINILFIRLNVQKVNFFNLDLHSVIINNHKHTSAHTFLVYFMRSTLNDSGLEPSVQYHWNKTVTYVAQAKWFGIIYKYWLKGLGVCVCVCLSVWAWLSVCVCVVQFYISAIIIANMSVCYQAYSNGQPEAYSCFIYPSYFCPLKHNTISDWGHRISLRPLWCLFV